MSRTPSVVGAAISIVQGCPAEEGLADARQSGPADVSPVLWAEVKAAIA
jgi:hypothetical protein